jgi:hypothetical protein
MGPVVNFGFHTHDGKFNRPGRPFTLFIVLARIVTFFGFCPSTSPFSYNTFLCIRNIYVTLFLLRKKQLGGCHILEIDVGDLLHFWDWKFLT